MGGGVGFHGATGLVHPRNIYIWPVASEGFLCFFNCGVCHRRSGCEEENLETWRRKNPPESLFPSGGPSPWVEADRPDLLPLRRLLPIITCIKHSNTPPSQLAHQAPPPLPRHIVDPFPHIFKALSSRTPWSDSQQGALQPIREVIHTLPHLSYLLYYHPGWPIPRRYPQRPGARAGYPGPGNAISQNPPRPPPLQN